MAHAPGWHLLDPSFPGADRGLTIPVRTTIIDGTRMQIQNLDRSDPPGYVPGGIPRSDAFNQNTFVLSPKPCMPAIPVTCSIAGFDPATSPIYWRLRCLHVLCRYRKTPAYRYVGGCETFAREWRGQSSSASFTLFGDGTSGCSCTYNDASRVLGGHALLEVAVKTSNSTLLDYVHMRIGGSNPTSDDICTYLQSQLSACDPNYLYMLQALFRHESGCTQFSPGPQSSARMTFTQPYHDNDSAQPNCPLEFIWPGDPSYFPLASFDFGVGLSQFTEVGEQRVTPDIAWDWRENVRQAANLFLTKLRREFTPGLSWIQWAIRAWAAYNGSGSQTRQYALDVAQTREGKLISAQPVQILPDIAFLPPLPSVPPPGPWISADLL